MTKKVFVSDLAPGDGVRDIFVIASTAAGRKKDGAGFLKLVLSDRSGSINAVAWDNVDRLNAAARSGNVVEVTGNVSEYQNTLQLTVKDMAVVERDMVDPAAFLPATDKDVDAMFSRLRQITNRMSSGQIKTLLKLFWDDKKFVEEQFKRAPAAKLMHHAYLGGLIEHTLSVVELALKICQCYGDILDQDLLVAGAMLHDIGKTREFRYELAIDYTDEGRLLNHIVCGILMLEEKLDQLGAFFPEETALQLKHLIASHHGNREFGSPEPPKTLEALVLNHIDEIDAKIVGVTAFMSQQEPGQTWTPFHRPMERFFYMGNKKES